LSDVDGGLDRVPNADHFDALSPKPLHDPMYMFVEGGTS